MTIKKIGQGKRYIKTVECKNCSAILEYTNDDVQSYLKTDYLGDSDTYYYINCPECKKNIYVKGGY